MTHPLHHAHSSVKRWGGVPEDYLPVHQWLDATKEMFCDFRHRALRHHSQGVIEAERLFGLSVKTANGLVVPTRYVALCLMRNNATYALRRNMPSQRQSTMSNPGNSGRRSAARVPAARHSSAIYNVSRKRNSLSSARNRAGLAAIAPVFASAASFNPRCACR